MRIDEMRELIGAELPNLDVQVSQVAENPHQRKVSGHRAAVNAARALRDTRALGPEIANILKQETFVDGTDPIVVRTSRRIISQTPSHSFAAPLIPPIVCSGHWPLIPPKPKSF